MLRLRLNHLNLPAVLNLPRSLIGLVRERQDQYGEPEWKVTQGYAYDGQQLSTLEVKWDDPVGRSSRAFRSHLTEPRRLRLV
jgi:hypothetical protein